MAKLMYYVEKVKGQWKIKHNNEHYGPYLSKKIATMSAVQAARKCKQQGLQAEVMVQDADLEWRCEWRSATDE